MSESSHHRERMRLRDKFAAILIEAAKERPNRPADVGSSVKMSWHQFEMETLLGAINWERAKRNLAPIEMRDLLGRESSAAGHIDYGSKLALYAVELVEATSKPMY